MYEKLTSWWHAEGDSVAKYVANRVGSIHLYTVGGYRQELPNLVDGVAFG